MSQEHSPTATTEPEKPPTKKKPRRRRILLTVIAALLTLILIGAIVIGVSAWERHNRLFRVQDPPNADRLTTLPQGSNPDVIDRFALRPPASVSPDTAVYDDGHDTTIRFSEHEADYWDGRVRGNRWDPVGDLLCEETTLSTGFCAMKFSDGVLVAQFDDELNDHLGELTELYLAGRRGERPAPSWFETTPPNVDRLPLLADLRAQMPETIADEPIIEESGPADGLLWSKVYGSIAFGPAYRAYSDHRFWGYYTNADGLEPRGDLLCERDRGICILAGSDGMLVIVGSKLDTDEIVAPVEAWLANE
ncbi:MAG: hypothetical protein Q4G67_12610 [Actinomycetia bacterium]|nr:hypothetical protein [Actinomycetes bacterium]